MDKFYIKGGKPLSGRIEIGGAKNSALPCMAASLLTSEPIILRNLAFARDIITQRRLLEDLGATVINPDLRTYKITAFEIKTFDAPYELVKTMRASILVLGPLLARFGRARVSLPGGCAIGTRPIDLHLEGLRALGASIELENGNVCAQAPTSASRTPRLCGGSIKFEKVTVTGTENLMMAATLARGCTVLDNAAREPEVVDLAELLIKMGAKIQGAGTSTIRIEGVEELGGAEHSIVPDRIEAGTFMIAAAITSGELEIVNCNTHHCQALVEKLREVGVDVQVKNKHQIVVRNSSAGLVAKDIITEEYPGFPTDMQAQYMALMTQAEGQSRLTEAIFENRFMHTSELQRLGANIQVEGRTATVVGRKSLSGAQVIASDLRASASLVLAGLAARGLTIIDRVYHIDRGYEKIEAKLNAVGAQIERVREEAD